MIAGSQSEVAGSLGRQISQRFSNTIDEPRSTYNLSSRDAFLRGLEGFSRVDAGPVHKTTHRGVVPIDHSSLKRQEY